MANSKIPAEGAGTATYNTTNHEFKYAKKGGWVMVYGEGGPNSNIPSGTSKKVGTLPEGYRPPSGLTFVGTNRVGTYNCVIGAIYNDGSVYLTPEGGPAAYWMYNVAFPV